MAWKRVFAANKTGDGKFGIDVPLFTSDGAWEEVLDVGTLIEEDVFVTGNFGSHSKENATVMKAFMAKHDKSGRLCAWNTGTVGSIVGENRLSSVMAKI